MIFSVDEEDGSLDDIEEKNLSDLGVLERQDLQEWTIEQPRILGEDLLIVTSEYANFQDTRDRLDILALDPAGKLVVVELKRDRADRTTDLQAIKYASYCATLTADDIQKDYREFWNDRDDLDLSPEDVGQTFADFLQGADAETTITSEGWAEFELDQKPRILLAAGSFGTEITAPVMWLIEEYGMDVTCTRIEAYEHQGRILLNTHQVIPVAEAEEYMTKRREKQEKQQSRTQRTRAINVLLERGILKQGDIVVFSEDKVPSGLQAEFGTDDMEKPQREYDPSSDFWRAKVTGDTGQSDNVQWIHNGETYSFTGLTKELLNELVNRDKSKALNGYKFWCDPEFNDRTLDDLRNSDTTGDDREGRSTEQESMSLD